MKSLNREADVVMRRHGLLDGKPQTLQRIADDLGISREGVRQIYRRGIRLMRVNRFYMIDLVGLIMDPYDEYNVRSVLDKADIERLGQING